MCGEIEFTIGDDFVSVLIEVIDLALGDEREAVESILGESILLDTLAALLLRLRVLCAIINEFGDDSGSAQSGVALPLLDDNPCWREEIPWAAALAHEIGPDFLM